MFGGPKTLDEFINKTIRKGKTKVSIDLYSFRGADLKKGFALGVGSLPLSQCSVELQAKGVRFKNIYAHARSDTLHDVSWPTSILEALKWSIEAAGRLSDAGLEVSKIRIVGEESREVSVNQLKELAIQYEAYVNRLNELNEKYEEYIRWLNKEFEKTSPPLLE
jgi:hypothetical protein